MRSGYIKYIVKIILSTGVLVLLGYLLKDNLRKLNEYDFKVNTVYLILSFILLLVASILLPIVWFLITKNINCSIGFTESLRIRLISEVGKYLPGRVLGYGYLMVYYKDQGENMLKVFSSSIYEIYLATFSSFLFFTIILLLNSFELFNPYRIIFTIISLLGIIALHPFFFQKFSDIFCKILKKEKITYNISYSRVLGILIMYLGYWIVFCIAFYLFIKAFTDIQLSDLFYISGSFTLSAFAGFIAFFLPAGIGAREGLLIYMLGLLTGNISAIVISISSRIWIITGDLILFCCSLISARIRKRNISVIGKS